MKYPPSQSDLWRIANKLHLYGEEWDEDEQKAISNSNRILSGLPMPTTWSRQRSSSCFSDMRALQRRRS